MKTIQSNADFLRGCGSFYDSLVDLAHRMNRRCDAEDVLHAVQSIAHFAWHCHPGRYADGAVENLAYRIGQQLETSPEPDCLSLSKSVANRPPRCRRRRVLHIASTALPIGGHTRWIRDWITGDEASDHNVLLTRQGGTPAPSWLGQAVERCGGGLVILPDTASLVSRAKAVRRLAGRAADLVVLYHHPDDVVPVVAFASAGGPPVALYNHADHVFWLGSSVADAVVAFRESGRRLSDSRRFPTRSELLPCPLPPLTHKISREQARRQLGVASDQIVLLSIGTAYKYIPTRDQNFFASAIKILNRHPAAHLYLIGVPWDATQEHLKSAQHDRLHFVGRLEDPTPYQAAADVYLEGFPFTSLTALLETVRFGVPVVAAFGASRGVLMSDDLALAGLMGNPASEEEYLDRVDRLVKSPAERHQQGERLRQSVETVHCGAAWRGRVESLYDSLAQLTHSPHAIPIAGFTAGPDDLALSEFHRRATGTARITRFLRDNMKNFSPAGLKPACRVPLRRVGVERAVDRMKIRSTVMWDFVLRKRNKMLARTAR